MDTVDVLQIKIDEAKSKLPEETLSAIAAVDWQAAILKLRETKGYSFEQLGDLEIETELLLCGLLSGKEYPRELERRMSISKAQVDELMNEMNESVFRKIREELVKITENKKIFGKKENTPVSSSALKPPAPKIITPVAPKSDSEVLVGAGIEVVDRFAPKHPTGEAPHPRSWFGEDKSQNIKVEKKEPLPILEKLELKPPIAPPPINLQRPPLPQAPKEIPHPLLAQKFSGYVQNNVVETQHTVDNIIKGKSIVGSSLPKPPMPPQPQIKSYAKNGDPYRLPPE